MNSPEFEQLLSEVFPTWDGKTPASPGLLKVEMTGSRFLRALDEKKAREIIQLMKDHFPKDIAFYGPSGTTRLVMWPGVHGTGSDLFFVVFATKEWEPVKDGEELRTVRIDAWL